MKKIELKYYTKIDDCYRVKLGNGFEFSFKQEKQAQSFLRKTNKFLTEQLAFINHVYSQVFLTYRQNYLLFTPDSGKRQGAILQAERNINKYLTGVSESLSKSVWMSNTKNGNYIVFSAFYYCVSALRNICLDLNQLVERQKLTTLKYQVINFHNEVNMIERSLNEYEQLKAFAVIERVRYQDIEKITMSKVV
ncbi:hypothetical protein [Labilibacter marinus]|uniref:hypothetical protein n=1 Tax=Labilibacter marinus TaxID=1477105 RepID=UPI001179B970|nr:hypothetical protein [Labilibacter marinus]